MDRGAWRVYDTVRSIRTHHSSQREKEEDIESKEGVSRLVVSVSPSSFRREGLGAKGICPGSMGARVSREEADDSVEGNVFLFSSSREGHVPNGKSGNEELPHSETGAADTEDGTQSCISPNAEAEKDRC